MSQVLETLMQRLGSGEAQKLSQMLGADEQKSGAATGAAITTLLGALQRNATKPDGAQALASALEKDHDGSILDNLGGFLDNPESGNGDGILKHVLGNRRPAVEQALGRSTGLDASATSKLLATVAPMVLGALGKQQRQGGLNANALAGFLGEERGHLERQNPGGMQALGKLFDADGDGDLDMGDLVKHGSGLLGKLFKR